MTTLSTDVWRARGIGGSNKLVLLSYARYADDQGYCWPGEDRVAAECGVSVRTVARAKAALTKLGVLRSVRRVDRQTGEPLSNITRLHVSLIRSMGGREPKPEPRVIAFPTVEVTVGNEGESSQVPTPCQVGAATLSGGSCQDGSQSLRDREAIPKSSPSSPLQVELAPGVLLEDEEETESHDKGEKPSDVSFDHVHADLARDLAVALPGRPSGREVAEMVPLLCAALDAGWAPSSITEYLVAKCDLSRVRMPGRVHVKNAREMGDPTHLETKRAERELCERCDMHGVTDNPDYATKDPLGSPLMCLHGKPDPWEDKQHREAAMTERLESSRREQEAMERFEARRKAAEAARAARLKELRDQEDAERYATLPGRREDAARAWKEFEPTGDPQADAMYEMVLHLADPPALEDLDSIVSGGMGMLDAGYRVWEVRDLLRETRPAEWRDAMIARWPGGEAN